MRRRLHINLHLGVQIGPPAHERLWSRKSRSLVRAYRPALMASEIRAINPRDVVDWPWALSTCPANAACYVHFEPRGGRAAFPACQLVPDWPGH